MRLDVFKNRNTVDGYDEDYIRFLVNEAEEYLVDNNRHLECVFTIEERFHELYESIHTGKLSEDDFKYVMMSFSNGYSYHPIKLHCNFDCNALYCAFNVNTAQYISISEENLVNYLSDIIDREDIEKWYENKHKETETNNQQAEEDLLKEIEGV